jgi:hypothetical protein
MTDETLRIVGVHGVGNYQGDLEPGPAAALISGWWHRAIHKGLGHTGDALTADDGSGPVLVQMAYYAHHLHTATTQGHQDLEDLDEQVQADIVAWARQLGADEPTVQGWLTAPARAAIAWVATKWGLNHAVTRALAARFFPEVATYFTDTDRRNRARNQVTQTITKNQPRVVIAHSLGTAITYEALWADPHPPIDLLITLGSPLAMPDIVYDRLAPHDGPRRRPPGVARWINITDPGDIIAIPPNGIKTRFAGLTCDLTTTIGVFDFHRATRYLTCPVTAAALA